MGKFLEVNGRTFVELAGILAGCGLLIGAFSMTGVISSLAGDLLRTAGGDVLLLLAMTALTSLVLGLGLTATACYIFLAILVGPALVLQGSWIQGKALAIKVAIGTLFICGGIQGYQVFVGNLRRARALEWPLRLLLITGGVVLATPGSSVLGFGTAQITGIGLAILLPTLALAALKLHRSAPRLA